MQVQYNALRNSYKLWETSVPYTISSQYSSYSLALTLTSVSRRPALCACCRRSRIAAAMDDYARQTCIRFVPRSSEHNYIYIYPDSGCWSLVGRNGGRQSVSRAVAAYDVGAASCLLQLSLGSGCIQKGIIIHELMHAVGFFHEQSRTDRDDYIDIQWANIQPGLQSPSSRCRFN